MCSSCCDNAYYGQEQSEARKKDVEKLARVRKAAQAKTLAKIKTR